MDKSHGLFFLRYLLPTLLCCAVLSCGSSPVPMAGNWSGTLTVTSVTPSQQETVTLTLGEDGSGGIHGTLTLILGTGPYDQTVTPVVGQVSHAQVSLSNLNNLDLVTIQGTVDSSGQHFTGTYSENDPGVGSQTSGNIALTKQ